MKKSVGYITKSEINNWIIPQKVQTGILNYFSNLKKKELSYIITEYFDSQNNALLMDSLKKDKQIENIFFLTIFQLKLDKLNFSILKKKNLFFFLENIYFQKFTSRNELIYFLKRTQEIKKIFFRKRNYLDLYKNFKKYF